MMYGNNNGVLLNEALATVAEILKSDNQHVKMLPSTVFPNELRSKATQAEIIEYLKSVNMGQEVAEPMSVVSLLVADVLSSARSLNFGQAKNAEGELLRLAARAIWLASHASDYGRGRA